MKYSKYAETIIKKLDELSHNIKRNEHAVNVVQTSLESIIPIKNKNRKQDIHKEILSYLAKFLAPSIIISLALWILNSQNTTNNSPLNYTLAQFEHVPKMVYPGESTYFSLSPFSTFRLNRNDGGLLKDLFLVTVNDEDSITVTAPMISNSSSETHAPIDEINSSQTTLLWNQKKNILSIHFPDIFFDMAKKNVSSAFLILKGQNHSYSVITFLNKLGNEDNDYADMTLAFTDLEIFDKRVWEEKAGPKTKTFFLKKYDNTVTNYKKVIEWLKTVTL